jgi:hypothetical protein
MDMDLAAGWSKVATAGWQAGRAGRQAGRAGRQAGQAGQQSKGWQVPDAAGVGAMWDLPLRQHIP